MELPRYDQDLFSDEGILEPYEHYRRIRDLGPVVEYPMHDCFVVGRYDDVRRVLRDAETFISGKGVFLSREMNEGQAANILTSDPPRHDFLRKIEGDPLSPRAISELSERVSQEADYLIERLMSGSRAVDAMTAIAQYLPLTVVTDLVGLPKEGRESMLAWAAAGFQLAGPFNARAQSSMALVGELVDYALNKVQPANIKMGSWAARAFRLAEEGTIPPEMARGMIVDLIGPSLDTTILGIGSLLMLLGQHPDQWRTLKADPSLLPGAVNEALRLESPVRGFTRYVARDAEIGGARVPEGARVLVLYGSANRDERRWDNAEQFDVRRSNSAGHLSFGAGRHACLGAHLARLEMQAILRAMSARVESFEIGEPVFVLNNILRGPQRLPMVLH